MGRSPCCNVEGMRKGAWTEEEDRKLVAYISEHGEGAWRSLPQLAGLLRCGKSCRLRWANYLNPKIKRGEFSKEEEQIIIRLHASLGNKWSTIAKHLPRRTDNEIKNHWNTKLKKRVDNVPDLIAPNNNGHANEIIISPEPPIISRSSSSSSRLLNVVAAKVNASNPVAQLMSQRIGKSVSTQNNLIIMSTNSTSSASSGSSSYNNNESTSVFELISDHYCNAFDSSPRSPRPISCLLNRMAARLSLTNRPTNSLLHALQSSANINNPHDYSPEINKATESEPISPNFATMDGRFCDDDYTDLEFGFSMDDCVFFDM